MLKNCKLFVFEKDLIYFSKYTVNSILKSWILGIIPRAIVHMFEGKERDEDKDTIYTVHVSYVEIYNEEIRDLLNEEQAGKKLDIKGNHGVIAGNNLINSSKKLYTISCIVSFA